MVINEDTYDLQETMLWYLDNVAYKRRSIRQRGFSAQALARCL